MEVRKIKEDVARVNEIFDNFYIKQTYCFEGKCAYEKCLEFNEDKHEIYAEFDLPYLLGCFSGTYDNLQAFIDDLVNTIKLIDVKSVAEENCYDKLDNPFNNNFPNIDKETAEVTEIKQQLLMFCEVLDSFVKGLQRLNFKS